MCVKFQILFSGKNKKNVTNLLSAEFAQRVVKVNATITSAADDILTSFFFFFFHFSKKIRLDITCDSSAWQMIHMKCQDLFSLKKNKCRLLQILLGALKLRWFSKNADKMANSVGLIRLLLRNFLIWVNTVCIYHFVINVVCYKFGLVL